PWYASEPQQLDGARVASVCDPVAVSRAWALFVLLDGGDRSPPEPFASPAWVRRYAPWLGRLWGDGLLSELTPSGFLRARIHRLDENEAVLSWSRSDPEGLLIATRNLVEKPPTDPDDGARRPYGLVTREPDGKGSGFGREMVRQLFAARPDALVEAVRILNAHRDQAVAIMTRYAYTDPSRVGGSLDRDLP